MKVYHKQNGELKLICQTDSPEGARHVLLGFLAAKDIVPPYVRYFEDDSMTVMDFGSWSEFIVADCPIDEFFATQ